MKSVPSGMLLLKGGMVINLGALHLGGTSNILNEDKDNVKFIICL